MPTASILFDLYKGSYFTLKEMNPTINGWKANFDDKTYALEWYNPAFGRYNIYCQPFYESETNMDIFIFDQSIEDRPYKLATIELEYLRYYYQKDDYSIGQVVTEFLNIFKKYIEYIEFKITQRMKYYAY